MMVIHTVHQVIGPFVENLVRKVVKEEIQSIEKKFLSCINASNHASETARPRERSLRLKFLDEISGPILTGKAILGKTGTHVRVAIVDNTNEQIVSCGPESSAKVEILVLDASDDVINDYSPSHEDFNKNIIREDDKKRPHFPKSYYIYLDKGLGILLNAKFGHDSSWMKSCSCRLGARVVGNLRGVEVKEGLTESFSVLDSRSKLYGNHYPPSLSDHVWRLENIRKDGPRCKLLNEKLKVFTVGDFLFLLSIDPQRLQKIIDCGAKWNATVDHARTCVVEDKKIYLYYPSSGSKMGVAFDVVGGLKGLIHDSSYVPVESLSADEKDRAHDLLLSAFENRKNAAHFTDENTLQRQFPSKTSSSVQEEPSGSYLIISENIDGQDATELWPSSTDIVNPHNESSSAEQIYDPNYSFLLNYDMPSPGQYSDFNLFLQHFGEEHEARMSHCYPERLNNTSLELHCHRRESNIAAIICVIRASMRFMASGGLHVHKRRRV
ncbi:Calmodulin-binding protein 60 A [Striga hermonthica]|uniref:Calmodulin-binding protein 60 A n=1 Tax=Striga hermonthica TaxID=68872 RepID=A0A9N7N2M0_STRHE|nr:Calmodulin-binding protein 60 A [Striga hermonthica]